ncbi:hypothetical protein, partial [Mitsuokella multacida]|uniref:hypothetical protein n=1 Tax=Mitsuokella multacida TaxID=52226 RepID=UPI0026588330
SESINPMKTPDTMYELYSVPFFTTGHPEYLHGSEIGSSKVTVQKMIFLYAKLILGLIGYGLLLMNQIIKA